MNYNEFRNPLLDDDTKLEIAIGAIEFRDKTIENLRIQIKELRRTLEDFISDPEDIDDIQYKHLK